MRTSGLQFACFTLIGLEERSKENKSTDDLFSNKELAASTFKSPLLLLELYTTSPLEDHQA